MYIILSIIIILLLYILCHKRHTKFLKQQIKDKKVPVQIQPAPLTTSVLAKQTNENPLKYPGIFSIKTFFSTSKAEKIIYEYLKGTLSASYSVFPHTSLTDIFSKTDNSNETKFQDYKFIGYHVDFVIYDLLYHPVMAIEIHGSEHKKNPKVIWTDQKKMDLFSHFKIPLIILDFSEKLPDAELPKILQNEIAKSTMIFYCWGCHFPITHPDGKQVNMISACPNCKKPNIPIPRIFTV